MTLGLMDDLLNGPAHTSVWFFKHLLSPGQFLPLHDIKKEEKREEKRNATIG